MCTSRILLETVVISWQIRSSILIIMPKMVPPKYNMFWRRKREGWERERGGGGGGGV